MYKNVFLNIFKFRKKPPVPEGGQLSITAGGMTEGHGTCGQTNSREKASPKGANHIQSCSCSPPSGTIREYLSLSAGSIPFGHSTSGYSHSPPSGTVECYLRNFSFYLPSQASGLSLAVSLRSWNWRMLSEPTAPNAWRVLTFCPLWTLTDFRLQYTEM